MLQSFTEVPCLRWQNLALFVRRKLRFGSCNPTPSSHVSRAVHNSDIANNMIKQKNIMGFLQYRCTVL